MKGGRPVIYVWTPLSNGRRLQQGPNRSRLIPCLKEVISEDQELYLYENITERPVDFQMGDILGMLLRRQQIAYFQPYFMTRRASFVAFNRTTRGVKEFENLNEFESDNLMPLLFLHICELFDMLLQYNIVYVFLIQAQRKMQTTMNVFKIPVGMLHVAS